MARVNGRLSTRIWIILLGVLFAALVATALLLNRPGDGHVVASVYVDGELTRQIDLSQLDEEIELTLEVEGGTNVIRARNGAVCMASASCPDQICVRRGWVSGGATPIVCLPHRVVIQLSEAQEQDIDVGVG